MEVERRDKLPEVENSRLQLRASRSGLAGNSCRRFKLYAIDLFLVKYLVGCGGLNIRPDCRYGAKLWATRQILNAARRNELRSRYPRCGSGAVHVWNSKAPDEVTARGRDKNLRSSERGARHFAQYYSACFTSRPHTLRDICIHGAVWRGYSFNKSRCVSSHVKIIGHSQLRKMLAELTDLVQKGLFSQVRALVSLHVSLELRCN